MHLRLISLLLLDFLNLNDFPALISTCMVAPESLVESFEEVNLLNEHPDPVLLSFRDGLFLFEVELEYLILDV